MRMTKDKFDTLKKLQGSQFTNAEKAKMVGLQPQSVTQYNRFDTWEDFCNYKANLKARKAVKDVEPYKVQLKLQTATLDDVIAKMQEIHDSVVEIHECMLRDSNWTAEPQETERRGWITEWRHRGE